MTGAGKRHASVGLYMPGCYKCAEFCILRARIALHGLGIDALVIALTGTRTELWFVHGCSGEPMLVTRGLIRVSEVFVCILGETWGQKAKP